MGLNIIDTYLKPNGELRTGNRPLFMILLQTGKSNYSIYDMDNDDKYNNGKVMFRGHFFISKDGTIFRGRPINTIGEFAYDENTKRDFNINSIGICVEGEYSSELMPVIQKNAVILLIQYLREEYKSLRTIYALDELVSGTSDPGLLFPLNEVISKALNVDIEPLRVAPNGLMRYAFKTRTLYYDAKKPVTGNDVKELQIILNLFKFKCDINGKYDLVTMNAIIDFQRSFNLIPDGIVGTNTFDTIRKASMKFYENRRTFNRILYYNQENHLYGEDIKHLQQRLNLLGYKCPNNNFYDEETSKAVRNFQEVHSLSPDGKVGPITWEQITTTDYVFIKRVLSYEMPMMFGDDVRLVQQRLNDLGFSVGIATGWYDEITKQQVFNFQKSKNMKADGKVDPETAKLLFK